MKYLPLLCIALLPFAAFAADETAATTAPAKPGVVIVNGKKFFPLQNARRFTGSSNSPSALSVQHHPRTQPPAPTIRRAAALQPAPASGDTSKATTTSPSDVLSVFAPEDKTPATK